MSTVPPVVLKVSWLQKIGHVITKVLRAIIVDAQPIEKMAVPVAKALLPGFIPAIDAADGIFSNIVKEAVAAEALATSAGQATGSGPQKLAQVLAASGPVLDAWVTANFPGAKGVSDVSKSGLVNAIVAILNEVDGGAPVAP
jgi:hypothetical protein